MGILDGLFKGEEKSTTLDMSTYDTVSNTVNTSYESQTVDEDKALGIASLYQGLNIICDTIASMPVYLFKMSDGFQEMVVDDPRND